jgi:hypothetical protein
MRSQEILNGVKIGYYICLIMLLLIFAVNYGFTDWQKVTKDFNEGLSKAMETVTCEIKTDEIYYKGMCTGDTKDFIYNMTVVLNANNKNK